MLLFLNSLNSPHNLSVTTHMLKGVGIAFPETNGDTIRGKKLKINVFPSTTLLLLKWLCSAALSTSAKTGLTGSAPSRVEIHSDKSGTV